MKRMKKLALSAILTLSGIGLAGCGFGNEGLAIDTVRVVRNDDGSTTITIVYTDVDEEDTVIVIPKGDTGEKGDKGNGIISATASDKEDRSGKTVTIVFDEIDEATGENRVLTFDVLNGQEGEAGAGIYQVTAAHDDLLGATELTITFTDGRDPLIITIPDAEKGDTGTSVTRIEQVPSEDGTKYIITFYGNEGGEEVKLGEVEISKANSWLSGTSAPTNDLGSSGDFYFESTHYYVYQKIGDAWKKVAELGSAKEQVYTVEFKANDSTYAAATIEGDTIYEIHQGMNFYYEGYDVPLATRDGYKFNGWITKKNYNVTLGLFTDLTPIYANTVLYAYWTAL